MKLAVDVAAESIVSCSLHFVRAGCLMLATAGLLFAGTAQALDGIDLSEPAEEATEGCPKLIQIKYPFLECANGQIGLAAGDDTWENSRQIPMQAAFIEGDGYFGPELNRD